MNSGRKHTEIVSVPDDHLGREDDDVRAAIRFTAVASVVGVGFVVIAALWVRSCGATDVETVVCGRFGRTILGLGAPAMLFGSGLAAFVRTYQLWRAGGTWWGWQGAGWFLMMLMLLTLTLGFIPIAGFGVG